MEDLTNPIFNEDYEMDMDEMGLEEDEKTSADDGDEDEDAELNLMDDIEN